MGKRFFRRRQIRNKPRRRRFVFNKLFWWFACLRPSEEEIGSEYATTEDSPLPAPTEFDISSQTKENHQVPNPAVLENNSQEIKTSPRQSRENERSSYQDERQDCLPDLISPTVRHLSSIRSMMGLSDLPIILPEDLEDVEDSFGMPVFLGAGNYGTVQLMRMKSTGQLCAVKSHHRHLNQQVAIKDFLREVRVLKALERIENTPMLYGLTLATDGGAIPAIVQEYIGDDDSLKATSLYDVIEKRSLSEYQSLQLALQISRTVQDMHNRGWLHCDLKGDNILLQFEEANDENEWDVFDIDEPWEQCDGFSFTESSESTDCKIKFKLIDFGLSCHADDRQEYLQYSEETQIEILETCRHVAPEVVKGQSLYTICSDVYALGLIFKDMSRTSRDFLSLTGEECMDMKPENRPTVDDVIARIEHELLQTDP